MTRIFYSIALAAGATIIGAIALMGLFLLIRAVPSLAADNANFITSSEFVTTDENNLRFGIADLFRVTVLSSIFALAIAVPIAIGIATFLTNYVPRRLRPAACDPGRPAGRGAVDRLRPVGHLRSGSQDRADPTVPQREPEVVLPLRRRQRVARGWRHHIHRGSRAGRDDPADHHLGVPGSLHSDPKGHVEAAQALGATKWEVIRMTVYPYGRSGMIAGSMLALGRALGETVAVLIILRTAAQAGHWSLFDGGYTFASKIASAAAEFSAPLPTGAYIAAGFVLFALTFVVNAVARFAAGGRVSGG